MKFRLVEKYLLEDIASVKAKYPKIDDKTFYKLIRLDPTFKNKDSLGTYGKWILNLYQKGNLKNIGHVKDLLTRFDENKKQLKNKDINSFKSMEEVDSYLNDDNNYNEFSHRQEVRGRQKDRRNADISHDLVFQGKEFDVYIPSSYANSCKLGQGTSWCTASTETDEYYNRYKNKYGGEYFTLLSRKNPEEKYQFHFESNQIMDSGNESVPIMDIIKDDNSLKSFLSSKNKIAKKLFELLDKYPDADSEFVLNVLHNKDMLTEYNITEDEAIKYIVRGYQKDTFYVFENNQNSNIYTIILPELSMEDWFDTAGDFLFNIEKIIILDNVTELDCDRLRNLAGADINTIDFGKSLKTITGDLSYILCNAENIKFPKSLTTIEDYNSLLSILNPFPLIRLPNINSLHNLAISANLIKDGDLTSMINFDYISGFHSSGIKLNIFTDNVEEIKKNNVELLKEFNNDENYLRILPYEDYDKYVKNK